MLISAHLCWFYIYFCKSLTISADFWGFYRLMQIWINDRLISDDFSYFCIFLKISCISADYLLFLRISVEFCRFFNSPLQICVNVPNVCTFLHVFYSSADFCIFPQMFVYVNLFFHMSVYFWRFMFISACFCICFGYISADLADFERFSWFLKISYILIYVCLFLMISANFCRCLMISLDFCRCVYIFTHFCKNIYIMFAHFILYY